MEKMYRDWLMTLTVKCNKESLELVWSCLLDMPSNPLHQYQNKGFLHSMLLLPLNQSTLS